MSFPFSYRMYKNPYHKFISIILLMQAIIRLIMVAITDPGYVLEGDCEDIETEIMCSMF